MWIWGQKRMGDAGYPRLWIATSGTVLLAVTEEREKMI